jgi:predicted DNA-binding protein with PD1-like motif
MPPSYTLSGRIYIIRLADGTRAAVRLTNFMNAASVKGYMTLEYQYPLE